MTHRMTPWVLAALLALPYLVAVTWDVAYEASPASTDPVASGDDQIRALKLEIRERGEEEHCWGTGGTGCVTDSGFHREGSGRNFYVSALPTVLLNPAATALGVDDDGRLASDDNGPDDIGSNYDDLTTFIWTGAAWSVIRAAIVQTFDSATINNDQLFDVGTIDTAPATLAMTGGAGAGGIPMVTVPAAGTWDIRVVGNLIIHQDAAVTGASETAFVRLQEQVGAGAFVAVAWCSGVMLTEQTSADAPVSCTFDYVRRAATVGTAYSYRLRISTTTSTDTADLRVDSTQAVDQTEAESPDDGFLFAEMTRR